MGLQQYNAKRHFDRTPEPRGRLARSSAERLRFVVQKHRASTLHYDFRLEMEGVLRSWAVTKEPTDDPTVKRLAVRTEDHPLEYASFEADIPKPEYGAGHVDIWDDGQWLPEDPPVTAFRRGRLKFELKGYGTTWWWLLTANTGHEAATAYVQATHPLRTYGAALAQLSAEEAARVQRHYDRVQLADATITHGLEALGFLRGHQQSVEQTVRNLEDDIYSANPDYNTQIALLNKLSATSVTAARLAKDANNVLVSVLEQQLLDATDRREAAVQGINAHIAFITETRPLLARTTAQTTDALTTFRIP